MAEHTKPVGFPPQYADTLREFCDEACEELKRPTDPFALEQVIVSLTGKIARDIRVEVGFHPAALIVPPEGPSVESPAVMNVPLDPTPNEVFGLSGALDNHWKMGGDRSGLIEGARADFMGIDHMFNALESRYGEDIKNLKNALLEKTTTGDIRVFESIRPEERALSRSELIEKSSEMRAKNFENLIESELLKLRVLSQFTGSFFPSRFHYSSDLQSKTFDVCERLLAHREKIRENVLLRLQGIRLSHESWLVESIVRQGYRVLLETEEMTSHDVVTSWDESLRDEIIEGHKTAFARCLEEIKERMKEIKNDPSCGVSVLDEPLRELDDFITGETAAMHRKLQTALQTFGPSPRRKLRDAVRCDEYREEMETLKKLNEYEALAAKQREFACRVLCETVKFDYAGKDSEGTSRGMYSHLRGMPDHVTQHRELNWFTGPWLMASLLIEGGIEYSRLHYCCVNEGTDDGAAATHVALLLRLSDGQAMFLDYGYKSGGRPFTSRMLENMAKAMQLKRFCEHCDHMSRFDVKTDDVMHVRIDPKIADTLRVYRDMHLMSLDQGFAAGSLLHTGISLKEEGNIEAALLAFELGLASFPTSPDLLCNVGMIELERKNFDRAEKFFKCALAEYGSHIRSLYCMGLVHLEKGDKEEACHFFERVANDPRDVWGDGSFKTWCKEYVETRKKLQTSEM